MIEWNSPHYTYQGKPFIPCVWEGDKKEPLREPFNTVLISLDGRLRADLAWKKAREEAEQAIADGHALLWEIDLGLFDQLLLALNNQTQYLSLSLSLEHFRDTLWQDFKNHTVGLSLYRGSVDFTLGFAWDEQQIANLRKWLSDIFKEEKRLENEIHLPLASFQTLTPAELWQSLEGHQLLRLFCRDVAVEYLSLLASRLPDAMPVYLFLDAAPFASYPLWQAQLLHPERFERFSLGLKGSALPLPAWGWQTPSYAMGYRGEERARQNPDAKEVTVGICLPLMTCYRPSQFQGLDEALSQLLSRGIAFRLIAEDHLITNWDELDYLLYTPAGLSVQGKRKLQGFCAAGGTVVSLREPLGLPYEVTVEEFVTQMRPSTGR